jgi:hypothetical protein
MGAPKTTQDLRRRIEVMPVKDSHTRIKPLALASGHGRYAGLGLFDQKSAIAVTMPIATAFKFCIRHRKNGLLNR